jgi:hypothetical protein
MSAPKVGAEKRTQQTRAGGYLEYEGMGRTTVCVADVPAPPWRARAFNATLV